MLKTLLNYNYSQNYINYNICQLVPFFCAFLKTAFIENFFGLSHCVKVSNDFHRIKSTAKNFHEISKKYFGNLVENLGNLFM